MRELPGLLLLLGASGCCCDPGAKEDASRWAQAVKREAANRQSYALEAGTANVFKVELFLPRGATKELLETDEERFLQREADELERAIAAKRGLPVPPPSNVPVPGREALELRETVEFTVLWPQPGELLEGSHAGPSYAVDVRRLESFGWLPVDPRSVTAEQLQQGVELHGSASLEGLKTSEHQTLRIPRAGRAVLTLVRSCKADVVEVTRSKLSNGSGVIAVPTRGPEQRWLELANAPCAAPLSVHVSGGPIPELGSTPSEARVQALRQQL